MGLLTTSGFEATFDLGVGGGVGSGDGEELWVWDGGFAAGVSLLT